MRRGQQRGSQPQGEKPTSHLLVVQVGEVDAIDFDNLVPCLVEKWRGIGMFVLSVHSVCWKSSPWRPASDVGSSSSCTSTLPKEQSSSGVLPGLLHPISLLSVVKYYTFRSSLLWLNL